MMTLTLPACSAQAETEYTPQQIAEVIIGSQEHISPLHPLYPDDDYFRSYVSDIYRARYMDVSDGAIYYTAGMLADEIAVFVLNEDADADEMRRMLEHYVRERVAAFTGYAPDQAAILENGRVVVQGNYVALIICQDTDSAQSAFVSCFGDLPPEVPDVSGRVQQQAVEDEVPDEPDEASLVEPPQTTPTAQTPESDLPPTPEELANDLYDPDAIIDAWRSQDSRGLSYKNLRILEACDAVIKTLGITDDMSDYDKELAVHDWIIAWADYDKEANSNAPDASPDLDNDNPYGLLYNQKAICTGYALTFQLFMDILGVECITVHGHSTTGGEHAWNMVRIDGEWYCVDVTWNDPTTVTDASQNHKHFNVPSKFLRDLGHMWDEESTPEATAEKLYR